AMFLVFLCGRRRARAALFPYTTLFRSHVGGDRRRRPGEAEGERLDEDPAHQVLAVAAPVDADRAAEDVGEQQHEHEGLDGDVERSEEHTSELQSRENLVCRLLLEKKKT